MVEDLGKVFFFSPFLSSPPPLGDTEDVGRIDRHVFVTLHCDNVYHTNSDILQELPGILEPLIYERDRFLAYRLRSCCAALHAQDPSRSAALSCPTLPYTALP